MNDDTLRTEYFDTLVRVAMKDMTIPQAQVFAVTVNLHTDLYVEKILEAHNKALQDRLLAACPPKEPEIELSGKTARYMFVKGHNQAIDACTIAIKNVLNNGEK